MSSAPLPAPESPAEPGLTAPGLADMTLAFAGVGLMGFGGVLPLARRMIVEDRRWLSPAEFTDLLALCQFLPGGNVINLSATIGLRFHGPIGSLAALAGLLAAPTTVAVLLAAIYERFQGEPLVRHLFAGLAAAAAGLILATVGKIAAPLLRQPVEAAIAAVCLIAIAAFRAPLYLTMLVLVPISIFVALRRVK